MAAEWDVEIIGQAKKCGKILPRETLETFTTLMLEMKTSGPYRHDWPNYTKMHGKTDDYHCHIEKGRPTYVACWKVTKSKNLIEVYYAGTHEKAPY